MGGRFPHLTPSLWGLLALAWMGVIFWLSAQPDLPHAPEPWLDMVVKKTGHAALYGVLAWLYLNALRGDGPPSGRARLRAFGLAVLYALTDEVHQSFVPGRTPSPWDVVIDGVGAGLVSGAARPGGAGPGRAQTPEPAR